MYRSFQVNEFLTVLYASFYIATTSQGVLKAADLIEGLYNYYYSGCVIILFVNEDKESGNFGLLQHIIIQKMLSEKGISSTIWNNYHSQTLNFSCKRNRPLSVVFTSGNNTIDVLRKVSPTANVNWCRNNIGRILYGILGRNIYCVFQISVRVYGRLSLGEEFTATTWLLFMNKEIAFNFFKDVDARINSDIVIAYELQEDIILDEVFSLASGHPVQVANLGKWKRGSGLETAILYKYERRRSLRETVLKLALVKQSPVIKIINEGNSTSLGGVMGEIWDIVQSHLQFTTEYIFPKDSQYGALEGNKWTGIVGMLVDNETDVGSGLLMTSERSRFIGYTISVVEISLAVFIKRDEDPTITWEGLLKPFHIHLWITIILTTLLLGSHLAAFNHFEHRLSGTEENEYHFSLRNSMFCVFKAVFCQQGHEVSPETIACRIIFLMSYLAGVVLLAAYSAKLISYLTLKEEKLPVSNFEQLLKSGKYTLGVQNDFFVSELFNNAADNVMKNAKKFIDQSLAEKEELLKRMCERNNYVYIGTKNEAMEFVDKLSCSFIALDKVNKRDAAFGLRKNGPYAGILNYYLGKMRSAGIMQRIFRNSVPVSYSTKEKKKDVLAVEMVTVFPIFFILMIGFVSSTVFLIIEIRLTFTCMNSEIKTFERSFIVKKTAL